MTSSKAGLLQLSSPKTDKEDSETDSEAEAGGSGNCLWLAGRARQVGAKRWVKWLVPFIMVGIASVLCMWMLHVATWYYVMGIVRFEKAYVRNPDYKEHPGLFSNSLRPDEVSYGSLQDPLSARLGFKHVPLKVLDGVALLFPFLWFLTVVYLRDVQQWTKVLLSHSVLAVGKGVFGVVTIMPDSIGWANCKERLGPSGVDFFMNRVPDPRIHGMWTTFMAILGVELAGPEQNRIGAGMRFCADMLYSGHTYFTILYILALCELVRKAIRMPKSPIYVEKPFRQKMVMLALYIACLTQQSIEVGMVLQNRFHYTSDVFLAILLTFLWYTSAPICIAAKWWAGLGEAEYNYEIKDMVLIPREALQADVWLPTFCVPFCCLTGSHHVISDRSLHMWKV